jgi:hypothetical protein
MANKVIYSVITIEYSEHNMGTDRNVGIVSFNTKEEAIDYFQFYNREQAEYLGFENVDIPADSTEFNLRYACGDDVEDEWFESMITEHLLIN